MKNVFEIPIYEKQGEDFVIVNTTTYDITYLNHKTGYLSIVVDGFLTKQKVDVRLKSNPCKKPILRAISEYIHRDPDKNYSVVKKSVTLESLRQIYNKNIIHNIVNHLLPVTKEANRDTLTEFNLI